MSTTESIEKVLQKYRDLGIYTEEQIETIRKRKLDHDNLYGSMKSLIDALCNELFIWDDDNIHLTKLKITQQTCKEVGEKEEYTLVRRTG